MSGGDIATILAAVLGGPIVGLIYKRWEARPAAHQARTAAALGAEQARVAEIARREEQIYQRQEDDIAELQQAVRDLREQWADERRRRIRLEEEIRDVRDENRRLRTQLDQNPPPRSTP